MTGRCFFTPGIELDAETVELPPQASHHLEHVLRLKRGDRVELRDGAGNAWEAEVSEIKKGRTVVRMLGNLDPAVFEPFIQIILVLGLARSDTMDMVVRQAVELGVSGLIAFRTARSQYGLTGHQVEKKKERWSRIAVEAICQCGRTKKPRIDIFEDLDHFLTWACGETGPEEGILRIVAREREAGESLRQLHEKSPSCTGVLAAIGPEGGWESSETARLANAGFNAVRLGPRILRFETAAVALISSIQLLWGDMGDAKGKGVE
ncbi:MAG: 16S rRNA (uracil(1498)-N(3))-methyltransferase [Syntrophobacteraceae bacterium]